MKKMLLVFFLFNFIFISRSFAHGDIHERIVEVTKAIEVAPDSAYLYFKRGKLYYQHNSFKRSIADLDRSKVLGYETVEQKLLFGKAYFGLNAYAKAMSFCDELLMYDPKNVRAIKLKARIYFEEGKFTNSALAFEELIQYSNQSFPENYVDASRAWEALDTKEGFHRATVIIIRGIAKLGHLVSLNNRLIEMAVEQKDYASAIDVQIKIIKLSPRKETAYYKLYELYVLNNNPEEAIASLNLAKEHYNQLPVRLQNTLHMKELIENIRSQETQFQRN
jgi:tetratricopeptide (TPR) repeat protein